METPMQAYRSSRRGGSYSRFTLFLALSVLLLAFVAVPAGAEPSGTVDATITIEGPCVTVSTATVDFGAVGFSQSDANSEGSTGSFVATNCSSQNQDMYGSATDAVGSVSGSWTLSQWDGSVLACDSGPDVFGAGLRFSRDGPQERWLSTSDSFLYYSTGDPQSFIPLVLMPCSGSSGVGETMMYSYTITGVLP
jgi:hypothetical protein